MLYLGEAFRWFAANALAGRIRSNQLGMCRLQPLQLLHQAIELSVRKFGSVQNVIKMFVMADGFAQLVDLALHGHGSSFHPIFGGSCHGLIIFRSWKEGFHFRTGLPQKHADVPVPFALFRSAKGQTQWHGLDFWVPACRVRGGETLVAVRTGVAVLADLFLRPLASQGLLYATLLARLKIIRVALYFLDDVFRLDFTFKPAQRVFQRLAFL